MQTFHHWSNWPGISSDRWATTQAWSEATCCLWVALVVMEKKVPSPKQLAWHIFRQVGNYSGMVRGYLFLVGCSSGDGEENAWTIYPVTGVVPEPSPEYWSNVAEADFRIWGHATQSTSSQILIYSPDTDVYNIGLNLVGKTNKDNQDKRRQTRNMSYNWMFHMHMNRSFCFWTTLWKPCEWPRSG